VERRARSDAFAATLGRVCTLIALHQLHRDFPLVVAANRDELYSRPTAGPTRLSESPRIVGGLDQSKGGTWLGVSAHGFFVGITNQRGGPSPALRSRGEVVLEALKRPRLADALGWLAALDGRAYNPFNLLFGDAARLYVAYARAEAAALEIVELGPGVWALPNDRLGSREFPKAERAVELATPLVALPWPELVPRAQAMLADHAQPSPAIEQPFQALCVHTPSYGTRSATLLALSARGLEHYLHAEGPPCQTPLRDCTELLHGP
jgi:uncharacterized protein with NRDE domain